VLAAAKHQLALGAMRNRVASNVQAIAQLSAIKLKNCTKTILWLFSI
jgi:hypothetical protein